MKNRKLDMCGASAELETRWKHFVTTDLKTFQTPEFSEALKALAVQLVDAEAENYKLKRAEVEAEQIEIVEKAKRTEFLY